MTKNCDNCINSGRPSYEWPCTVCTSAYGSAPSKWESVAPVTADLVEVIRCKDCKNWFKNNGHDKNNCPIVDPHIWMDDNGYCSYGERKDNG